MFLLIFNSSQNSCQNFDVKYLCDVMTSLEENIKYEIYKIYNYEFTKLTNLIIFY